MWTLDFIIALLRGKLRTVITKCTYININLCAALIKNFHWIRRISNSDFLL